METFIEGCFGRFPKESKLEFIQRWYMKGLGAIEKEIEPKNYFKIAKGLFYPIKMGSHGIEVYGSQQRDPVIFYMDGTSPQDVMDFWNLRALGWKIIPIPLQWENYIERDCIKFIKKIKKKAPNKYTKLPTEVTFVKSRTASLSQMQSFTNKLEEKGKLHVLKQSWYPRIWDEWARDKDNVERCNLVDKEVEEEVEVVDDKFYFHDIVPSFLEKSQSKFEHQWSTVVTFRNNFNFEFGSVIPSDIKDLNKILGGMEHKGAWTSSEGIVLPSYFFERKHFWQLPSGQRIFQHWMKEKGIEFDISDKGHICSHLIRSLGGLWNTNIIGNEEVIKKLEVMSKGTPINNHDFFGLLSRVNKGNIEATKNHLSGLISHGVLQIGLELQCQECLQHSWYSLSELEEKIICKRCVLHLKFPSGDPPQKEKWQYKTTGPFSVSGYAGGSYTVALALNLLAQDFLHETTWAPSFTLEKKGFNKVEIDFGIISRGNGSKQSKPYLIFGECKTFDNKKNVFGEEDIKKMNKIGNLFPKSVLAFCTLRNSLTTNEKRMISRFAKERRGKKDDDKKQNPVLVLTGIELFSFSGPPYCWADAGGKFAKFAENYRNFGEIDELCYATQQLHLGLEPYEKWRSKELAKKRKKTRRKNK